MIPISLLPSVSTNTDVTAVSNVLVDLLMSGVQATISGVPAWEHFLNFKIAFADVVSG